MLISERKKIPVIAYSIRLFLGASSSFRTLNPDTLQLIPPLAI